MKEKTKCYCGHTTYCDCGPKQETLEEAINSYVYKTSNEQKLSEILENAIRFGAKWQKEQDKNNYSAEEVLNFTQTMIMQYRFGNTNIEQMDLLKETLQLFKNK